ncbi:MAG: RNase H family protein, partial [Oscillospiraceae bacterium]
MKDVTIYTDGACSGNPGAGGWGAILKYKDTLREISGGEGETTNNRMEMQAVISALTML